MIRGYRWKTRDGQPYLTRVSDGCEVATVYPGGAGYWWSVRGRATFQNEAGTAPSFAWAKQTAEAKVKVKEAAGTLI